MRGPCWLAEFAPDGDRCDGPLQRAHLVRQQTIRREVWNRREVLRPLVEALGKAFPRSFKALAWDERCWVWACKRHHDMLDQSRKIRVPGSRLPRAVIEYCGDYGLMWWLERTYGDMVR